MGQILSHSEVEAVLAALDFTSNSFNANPNETAGGQTADPTPYDFEHPEPLRSVQLDRLRLACASASQSLQAGLTGVLRTPVMVNFLGVEQSTFRDYLATAERPGCVAVFESSASSGTWLLDIGRSLAFTIIDCMLGGQPTKDHPAVTMPRPFTEVETRLIEKAVRAFLPELAGDITRQSSLRMTRLITDSTLIPESSSNEAVALVSFEFICGQSQGLMQLCIPWKQVAQTSSSFPTEKGELRQLMRSGAVKIPVTATARVANLKLSAREIAGLSPGDVLLTDASPLDEIRLEVDGQEIFRGTPGQSHDRKVILLTTPITQTQTGKESADKTSEVNEK